MRFRDFEEIKNTVASELEEFMINFSFSDETVPYFRMRCVGYYQDEETGRVDIYVDRTPFEKAPALAVIVNEYDYFTLDLLDDMTIGLRIDEGDLE